MPFANINLRIAFRPSEAQLAKQLAHLAALVYYDLTILCDLGHADRRRSVTVSILTSP
jgi:hypothetical protein